MLLVNYVVKISLYCTNLENVSFNENFEVLHSVNVIIHAKYKTACLTDLSEYFRFLVKNNSCMYEDNKVISYIPTKKHSA